MSFTILLWWIPKPEVRASPLLSALIFGPYWVEAAFVAYVTALFYGTLFVIVDSTGMLGSGEK